jgi:hypothetical protein
MCGVAATHAAGTAAGTACGVIQSCNALSRSSRTRSSQPVIRHMLRHRSLQRGHVQWEQS